METNTALISSLNEDVLNKRTSFQINTWSSFSKEMTINEVFQEIQSNKYKSQVQNLRALLQNDKKEQYNSHKRTLPAVTFCGTFDGERKKEKIKCYNSVIVLDVDKLDEQELKRVKECFHDEPFVFSFWESPSKEGLKGIVSLKYNIELNNETLDRAHKGAFQKLAKYFKEKHNVELDNSGSDTTRLCFFSYDPLIIIKDDVIQFEITENDLVPVIESKEKDKINKPKTTKDRDALFNPANRNNPGDRYTMAAIIRFLKKRNLSITNSYEEWYKVAMAISNTFTFDIGEKYFKSLSLLDENKFDEINCNNFLKNCYESRNGSIKFHTIVYFANKKGYITKKQRERGSEAADGSLSHVSSS